MGRSRHEINRVTQATKQKAERFFFEGREIPLNLNYGVFITMNPGYAEIQTRYK